MALILNDQAISKLYQRVKVFIAQDDGQSIVEGVLERFAILMQVELVLEEI